MFCQEKQLRLVDYTYFPWLYAYPRNLQYNLIEERWKSHPHWSSGLHCTSMSRYFYLKGLLTHHSGGAEQLHTQTASTHQNKIFRSEAVRTYRHSSEKRQRNGPANPDIALGNVPRPRLCSQLLPVSGTLQGQPRPTEHPWLYGTPRIGLLESPQGHGCPLTRWRVTVTPYLWIQDRHECSAHRS
jgi:hypothetical protein